MFSYCLLYCLILLLIADDSNLIHESNIDITLAIFNDLNSLSRLDIRNRYRTGFDYNVINLLDLSC